MKELPGMVAACAKAVNKDIRYATVDGRRPKSTSQL
jgi:hypothetical protein